MDIDAMGSDYDEAMYSLKLAEKYGLQVEVFCTAIDYIRRNPNLSIAESFIQAQYDWDVCVPLSDKEIDEQYGGSEESPEEIEEFNNHMRALAKAKEPGELASNPESAKEKKWPQDFDSKH